MNALIYSVISLLGVSAFIILIFAIKSKKLFKTLLLNAFTGIAMLAIIDLTAGFTGVYIPVNWYTVLSGGVFGIPALCGLLLLKLIFV